MLRTADLYVSSRSIDARIRRRWTDYRRVAPLGRDPQGFTLSLSFDDVPDSAATTGAEILAREGIAASWYIATGLLDHDSPSGRILGADRLRELAAAGQEIALHGHSHRNMRRIDDEEAIADIRRNRAELAQILGEEPAHDFAYPYGETRVSLKRRLIGEVPSARGVSGRVNRGNADRLQLAGLDLRPAPDSLTRARAAMKEAAEHGGWVILFTHDVSNDPSPYGVTPATLSQLIAEGRELGARFQPVGAACRQMTG